MAARLLFLLAGFAVARAHTVTGCGRQSLLPLEGVSGSAQLIMGGTSAQRGAWPWQVSLYTVHPVLGGTRERHSCGGTLISPQWVLTSANCLRGDPLRRLLRGRSWRARLGKTDLSRHEAGQLDLSVSQVVLHPRHDPETRSHDVALLKLRRPVELGRNIAALCLPSPLDIYPAGTICVGTGWGRTYNGSNADVLQEMEVEILRPDICGLSEIDNEQLCAGRTGEGRGTCRGDTGGPLQCQRPIDHSWVLAGIASHGQQCGRLDLPDVYTRTSPYVEWIRWTMNQLSGALHDEPEEGTGQL